MIAAIEDAIIGQIKTAAAALPGLGYTINSVASYGGELDGDLAQVVRSFPGVWVTYTGSGKPRPYSLEKSKWVVPVTFAVMVGARNVRGERATRHGLSVGGQTAEVGVYQMLDDIGLLLINQDFGLAIKRLAPGATRTLYNTKLNNQALAVFAREWHTEYIEAQPSVPIDVTNPDWLRLGINYYLTPGDALPDASDLTTLR
jgi:phage gp37-like protein